MNDLQLLLAHFVHFGVLQVGESSEHQVVVGQLTTHTGCCVYKVGFDGCEVKVGSILRTVRADADLYKRIGTRVSLPPLAVAQRMEVTVGKGRGGVTLALTLKDASYH